MNRIALFLALVLTSIQIARADGFESVFSSNGVNVWAVGNNGNVFRSADGGATWASSPLGTATLRSIHGVGLLITIVGDQGACYRSTNNGETFALSILGAGAALHSVFFVDAMTGWIGGDGGTLLKTTDGGASWNSISLSTVNRINAVKFSDANTGWIVGAAGLARVTTDGGASWSSVASGLTADLYGVDFSGLSVYVVGADASAALSTNGGTSWAQLDFKFDSRSDINDVTIAPGGTLYFCGGGGFIQRSTVGSSTSSSPLHPMMGELREIFFFDANKGWACSNKNNAVIRTSDGGATWQLPTGTTLTTSWIQKLSLSATVRGNAIAMNPWNKNTLYCALGTSVYASYNRGETWAAIATLPTGGSKVNSFYISPKDTNLWVAAYGAPDRIVRTTNRGATWVATITKNFSEYGMPLELDGSHPDTLIFGPEDGKIWRSVDFGATWDSLSNPGFRSPCDIVVVRDDPNVIWVGDGVTGSGLGQMFRSTNGGKSFTLIFSTTGSEIPTVGSSAIDNTIGYATAWSSGGVMKTSTTGVSWSSVATTGSAWGVDIAKDDPNVIMYGVYGGGTSYLSTNAGTSFATAALTGSNYAMYAYDRGTYVAQQSGGIYKMNISYVVPTVSLPIQLASFAGRITSRNRVVLEWTTISEVNNYGFIIQRRRQANEPFTDISDSFVAGHGTTNEPQLYSFVDTPPSGGSWDYRLKQIDLDGTENVFEPIQISFLTGVDENRIPTTFFLSQNYPNPFNPATVIRYGIPQTSHVILGIFDALGQTVHTLVDEVQAAGVHDVVLDASVFPLGRNGMASGVYLYRIQAGDFVSTKKFMLLR